MGPSSSQEKFTWRRPKAGLGARRAREVSSICGAAVVVRKGQPMVVNHPDVRDVVRGIRESNYLGVSAATAGGW